MTSIACPDRVLLDDRVPLRVTGLDPGTRVILRTRRETDPGNCGVAATFEADDGGVVDPSEQAPIDGDYEGVRPMGLFQFRSAGDRDRDDGPVVTTVTASVDGTAVASTTVERRLLAEEVTTTDVDHPDLVGDLYLPPGDGPHPGVVVLGGSGGGRPSPLVPGLLASRGYAALGLAYFGEPGLPDELLEVPVEYFERAVEWFGDWTAVSRSPMGAIGVSRGGEPALVLGTRRPEVRTVIGIAASPVVFQGISRDGTTAASLAADGESLPFVPFRWGPAQERALAEAVESGEPLSFVSAYSGGLEDADEERIEAATIPVEEVGGPVLLLSGEDDRTWNAAELGDRAVARLETAGYDHPCEHRVYPDAGHAIRPPYLPVEGRETASGPAYDMAMGGTPEGYADADPDAWTAVLEWLDRGLRPGE